MDANSPGLADSWFLILAWSSAARLAFSMVSLIKAGSTLLYILMAAAGITTGWGTTGGVADGGGGGYSVYNKQV